MKTIAELKEIQLVAENELSINYGLGSEKDIQRSEKRLDAIKKAIIYLEFNPSKEYLENTRNRINNSIVSNPGNCQDNQFNQLEFLNLILD